MTDITALRATWEPRALSVLRIMAGLLFIEHGTAKLFGFPHVAAYDDLSLASLLGAAGLIETFGGILVLIGLFTRPAAFVLSGEMAVGYFLSHAPRSFFPVLNQGDAAVLYCFVFLYIFVAGPGIWSLDQYLWSTASGWRPGKLGLE